MKMRLVWLVAAVALFVSCGQALAGGVGLSTFSAGGGVTVCMLENTTGVAVTGLHIEFDRDVTIVNKIEFGGYLPALGPLSGTTFDFNGGQLLGSGTVELDWTPADAKPTLVMWMNGARPVGTPYFTTIEKLGWLLAQGIVGVREADPARLQAVMTQFFTDNVAFFGTLSQALGMDLQQTLLPVIMNSPAEAIQNFFNTMIGMLGVTDLQGLMQSQVNLSALLNLLGL